MGTDRGLVASRGMRLFGPILECTPVPSWSERGVKAFQILNSSREETRAMPRNAQASGCTHDVGWGEKDTGPGALYTTNGNSVLSGPHESVSAARRLAFAVRPSGVRM